MQRAPDGQPKRDRQAGFTLIEVLVALAVFSIAAYALLALLGQNARSAGLIERKVLAHIVAQNQSINVALAPVPQVGSVQEGEETQLGVDWRWRVVVEPTPNAVIVRVGIDVRAADSEQIEAHLELYRAPNALTAGTP